MGRPKTKIYPHDLEEKSMHARIGLIFQQLKQMGGLKSVSHEFHDSRNAIFREFEHIHKSAKAGDPLEANAELERLFELHNSLVERIPRPEHFDYRKIRY